MVAIFTLMFVAGIPISVYLCISIFAIYNKPFSVTNQLTQTMDSDIWKPNMLTLHNVGFPGQYHSLSSINESKLSFCESSVLCVSLSAELLNIGGLPQGKTSFQNLNSPYCSYKSDLPHRRVHQIEHTSTLKSALSDSTDSGKVLLAFSAFYGSPAAASALQENFNFFSAYLFIYLLTNMHDVSQSFFFILIRIYFVCSFLCSYLTVHLLMWDKTFCF